MSEDDEGHGAAILSFKSQVKLKPVELSYTKSAGKLRSKHPALLIASFISTRASPKISIIYHFLVCFGFRDVEIQFSINLILDTK